MKISVIIPTRDRAFSLQQTLISLLPQLKSEDEIIVIDNSLKNSAKRLINKFNRLKLKTPILYKIDLRNGPSYARNLGIKSSRNEILAFLDDDCIINENWANSLRKFYSDNKNENVILQGKINHIFKKKDVFSEILILKNQYSKNKLLDEKNEGQYINYLNAGNFACLSKITKKYKYFFDEFNFPFIGEEKELSERLNLDGYLIVYNETLSVNHIKQNKSLPNHLITYAKYGYNFGKIHKKFEQNNELLRLFRSDLENPVNRDEVAEIRYISSKISGSSLNKAGVIFYLLLREILYKLFFTFGYCFGRISEVL